jgi:hypothetical protein
VNAKQGDLTKMSETIRPDQLMAQAARLGVELSEKRAEELAAEVAQLLAGASAASSVARFEDEPTSFLAALAAARK